MSPNATRPVEPLNRTAVPSSMTLTWLSVNPPVYVPDPPPPIASVAAVPDVSSRRQKATAPSVETHVR
jgi:hypothetical protein